MLIENHFYTGLTVSYVCHLVREVNRYEIKRKEESYLKTNGEVVPKRTEFTQNPICFSLIEAFLH